MVERDTVETDPSTVVVVIGGPDKLIEACQRAAGAIPMAEIITCDIQNAATAVASKWPFALVVSEDLYLFDSQEFEDLARDVAAQLIRIHIDKPIDELAAHLRPLIIMAYEARDSVV